MGLGGSFLARPLSVISGQRGKLEGIGGIMGTVPCSFSGRPLLHRHLSLPTSLLRSGTHCVLRSVRAWSSRLLARALEVALRSASLIEAAVTGFFPDGDA